MQFKVRLGSGNVAGKPILSKSNGSKEPIHMRYKYCMIKMSHLCVHLHVSLSMYIYLFENKYFPIEAHPTSQEIRSATRKLKSVIGVSPSPAYASFNGQEMVGGFLPSNCFPTY